MSILFTGMVIGLAVAAPVGPIGILCIRRAIVDGRLMGLATGMGAAVADACYGVLAATGFSLSGVLVSHAQLMQFGGGGLIALLGLLTFRRFFFAAMPTVSTAGPTRLGLSRTFLTTFLLTLSNPMTILSFVGLIAGLGSVSGAGSFGPFWLVTGVFLGSALWWVILVQMALMARSLVTPERLRWLDAISGAVLTVWGGWIVFQAF